MIKRGRKKGANGEQSRALLLFIAADEFARKGYFETKVSTIVHRANLSQPTFYLYFESKEAIFKELVKKFRYELFNLTIQSRLETGLDLNAIPRKITQGLAAIFRFFAENQSLTRIGFFLSQEAEEIKKQLAAQIKENLIYEQQNGYFHPDANMLIIAESLVGIIERLTITQIFEENIQPEILANEIVHLLLDGLLVKT
ncbi:TetR family transcriptional regulator [Peribacillus butanolivorans]|uniref:TetR/AcrR family transcriptional regulator n=1 Tax=Peribacillus butanolivorans TaxID=421767 RepID=UPI0006A6AAA1|nr:TetR/AcrR family transcriptional regulator [Peribacillus butanolivorans]KON70512.1 TetR family transcriptional regulator [Peribacillus butanolivorans]